MPAESKKRRSLSATQILTIRSKTLALSGEWGRCLGTIDRHGVALVWGPSGSGKSNGVMMLAKELSRFGKVLYVSLEEGFSLSFRNTLLRFGMEDCGASFQAIDHCAFEDLTKRLFRKGSPEFVVVDSIQYMGLSYRNYLFLKAQFPNKLFVLISHAAGKQPEGRAAGSILYDADIKVWVEGGKAFTRGRFFGPDREAVIWPEKAFDYYGKIHNVPMEGE